MIFIIQNYVSGNANDTHETPKIMINYAKSCHKYMEVIGVANEHTIHKKIVHDDEERKKKRQYTEIYMWNRKKMQNIEIKFSLKQENLYEKYVKNT